MDNTTWSPAILTRLEISFQYIGFGLVTVVINIFVLSIVIFNRLLLKQFAFIFGLAVGDVINGLSLLTSGILRIIYIYDNTIYSLVHPTFCIAGITPLFILGNQLPSMMFFFIGIERCLAVWFFSWYRKNWNNKVAWIGIMCSFLVAIFSLSGAYITTSSQPNNTLVTKDCSTPSVVGHGYIVYMYTTAAFGGMVAFVPTLGALMVFYRRKKQIEKHGVAYSTEFKEHIKKNVKVTKLLLGLAFLDITLVSIPYVLQLLIIYKQLSIATLSGWLLQLVCIRGWINLFIYFFTNKQFRSALLKMLICGKIATTTVSPVQNLYPFSPQKESRF